MNVIKISVVLAFAGTAVTAFAGPDWTVIERARLAAHLAQATVAQLQQPEAVTCVQMLHRSSMSKPDSLSEGNAVGSYRNTGSGWNSLPLVWTNMLTSVKEMRSPYLDGGRTVTPVLPADVDMSLAGMDSTGVSAPPSRARDPYTDGARVHDDAQRA
ncbi:hypothetical protein [Cupriavidus pauculus]|uniref:hypothetical protein n=1 Tax=Cupriavidus pauculus TaxID=82633 RepID=UPI0015DFD029|nr:hypothetical protein [Cupriavidus pauculus]